LVYPHHFWFKRISVHIDKGCFFFHCCFSVLSFINQFYPPAIKNQALDPFLYEARLADPLTKGAATEGMQILAFCQKSALDHACWHFTGHNAQI